LLDARADLPFIFVSASLGEEVAIEAVKNGATDYVVKSRLSRLVPCVQRALREAQERAERKKAEEAFRRSELENAHLYRDVAERERKIRRLIDANIIGICMWNFQGAVLEANDAFLHIVQYSREDLVSGGVRWTDLTPAERQTPPRRSGAPFRLTSERQAAARDRRVLADHDAEVCDGARGLGLSQHQGKPCPVGQFPASVGDAHALLLGARGHSEQHQRHRCEYGGHPEVFAGHFQMP
jgi:PAS domain-containing protein